MNIYNGEEDISLAELLDLVKKAKIKDYDEIILTPYIEKQTHYNLDTPTEYSSAKLDITYHQPQGS
jgi:hypothetical protein